MRGLWSNHKNGGLGIGKRYRLGLLMMILCFYYFIEEQQLMSPILLSSIFRVSFGSSKGSMVETLVFEAPTPLPEHSEREFSFPEANDDSGIELQEE